MLKQNCSIIIPVYNAFEEALGCLRSVIRHTSKAHRVFIIDDASPEGDFRAYCGKEFTKALNFHFIRNITNQGFVKSCNNGMRLAEKDDVVLLNSDTLVTPGWLKKIQEAAYSNPKVGSVTPLTNNGTICSFPRFGNNNPIPTGISLNEFSRIVESCSVREYPPLPTAVGFCMYIRREALDIVGLFDEESFGLGYGEENDLSCRIEKVGYQNILDDATYIYHKGNMSFKDMREKLSSANTETLKKQHPDYFEKVARFCEAFPLKAVHYRIFDRVYDNWRDSRRQRVLHVVHNGPFSARIHMLGGTELHVQDLICNNPSFEHWSLCPLANEFILSAHFQGLERDFVYPGIPETLSEIMQLKYFDLIHVHHVKGYDLGALSSALEKHGNYIVSLHDFMLVCPRINLLTPQMKLCNTHECVESCGIKLNSIQTQRDTARRVFKAAKAVITFSESTRNTLATLMTDDFSWHRIKHGICNVDIRRSKEKVNLPRPSSSEPLKIALLGYMLPHKGSEMARVLIERTSEASEIPVQWHLLGSFHGECPGLIQHGLYTREEIRDKLIALAPHLVLMVTPCPETYSLTLDEAWNAGIPVIVPPIGALSERVRQSGAGWVLPNLSIEAIQETMDTIVSNWLEYEACRDRIDGTDIWTLQDEATKYSELYRSLMGQIKSNPEALEKYTRQYAMNRYP